MRSERVPFALEVLVHHGQGDVRQQGRQDPALRGAGVGGRVHAVLAKDAGFQVTTDHSQDTLVNDPHSEALLECVGVVLIEARGDVRLESPARSHVRRSTGFPRSRPTPVCVDGTHARTAGSLPQRSVPVPASQRLERSGPSSSEYPAPGPFCSLSGSTFDAPAPRRTRRA